MAASKDQDPGIRQSAIQALGQIEDPRAVDPVIDALNDTDQNVRVAAIRSLGKMRNPRVVEPLIAALRDRREIIRIEATWALKKNTGEDFGSDLNRWRQWQRSQQRPATITPKQ
jgi:HEAT repeat protein